MLRQRIGSGCSPQLLAKGGLLARLLQYGLRKALLLLHYLVLHLGTGLFDRDALPRREQAIRNTLKREGLWMR